jgi:hypothetical protein
VTVDLPGKVQTEVLAAGVVVIAGLAALRDLSRSASAHAPELLVIAQDLAAAVIAAAAVLILLLAARSVARREGRHCQPPVQPPMQPPVQQPREARVQYPGQPAYSLRLRPPADEPAEDLEMAHDEPLAEYWRR